MGIELGFTLPLMILLLSRQVTYVTYVTYVQAFFRYVHSTQP